ncbi:MAG: glycosyl hydrolase family 28-related protein [Verrucomicrobiota bacterium]
MIIRNWHAALVCALLLPGVSAPAAVSELWGDKGEKWSPTSRLPDFSYAGYHCGEAPIPTIPPGVSIKSFGAKGDGIQDDTQAFLNAIAKVESGAIEIPAGRYKITQIIEIRKPNLVLRGADPKNTVLFCPIPLEKIKPNMGMNTGGRPTSNYSWSGGFLSLRGDPRSKMLATVTAEARRGDTLIQVSSTAGFTNGQWVMIAERDTPDNSLATHLYSNDPGNLSKIKGNTRAALVTRIKGIKGGALQLERPLRADLKAIWKPEVLSFIPTVSECGIENLCFEFPVTDYLGHFTELGYNPISLGGVINCWVRNIRIVNADSGLFISGRFNTVDGVVYESHRKADRAGYVGHHGIYLGDGDNLFTHFDYRQKFIHDISVSHGAGNVCSCGQGVDLCFDHHKRAPYENLFTDIDVGAGTRPWMCGGGADLGKHSGARETFWNLRAKKALVYPPSVFGPPSMNLVGVQSDQPSVTDKAGKWHENIQPAQLQPKNLYEAQLARRRGTLNP